MASYALFLRAPDTGRPDAELGLDDGDVLALGVSPDPYIARQVWSGESLAALRVTMDAKVTEWRAAAIAAVLAETHRAHAEPWMDTMIAARVAEDRRIGHADALLTLIARAVAEGGTLVFFGD